MRGNIVSRSAAKLIQSFLLNTMASTGKAIDDDESEAEVTEDEPEIPPLQLQTDKFQQLLQCADNQDNDTTAQKITRSVARRMSRKAEYQQSHRIGEAIWKTTPSSEEASSRANPTHTFGSNHTKHLEALTAKDRDPEKR